MYDSPLQTNLKLHYTTDSLLIKYLNAGDNGKKGKESFWHLDIELFIIFTLFKGISDYQNWDLNLLEISGDCNTEQIGSLLISKCRKHDGLKVITK